MDNQEWNLRRLDSFQKEIAKMFLAYNKPIQPKTIEAKANLMNETLYYLDSDKIGEFFKYVRETEEKIPTDGRLKFLLRTQSERFKVRLKQKLLPKGTKATSEADLAYMFEMGLKYPAFKELSLELIQNESEIVSDDFNKRFFEKLKHPENLVVDPDYGQSKFCESYVENYKSERLPVTTTKE